MEEVARAATLRATKVTGAGTEFVPMKWGYAGSKLVTVPQALIKPNRRQGDRPRRTAHACSREALTPRWRLGGFVWRRGRGSGVMQLRGRGSGVVRLQGAGLWCHVAAGGGAPVLCGCGGRGSGVV